MSLYQHNHVGKIKETVKVTFENGYSIILEAGVETSMSLTMYEGAKNTEQQVQLDSEQKQGAFDNPVDARTALGITRIQRTRTGNVLRH